MEKGLFSSESVGIGHPDKICDMISDSILDECLRKDEKSHVAVETLVTKQFVIVSGEIKTNAKINYEEIVRNTIKEIGYVHPHLNFDYKTAEVVIKIHEQSSDISKGLERENGAGDQGLMFGYACNETSKFMPLGIVLANEIVCKARELIELGCDFIFPDCKSQITLDYSKEKPFAKVIVFSINHSDNIPLDELREYCKKEIILPVCSNFISSETEILVNPAGKFVIGGPSADSGLTGRKIIVDSYGGYARHGGGAFSGKDPSKVDRSGAYMARWIAKNLVAAGFCEECEIQLSYAIGYNKPLAVNLNFFGTEKYDLRLIDECVKFVFDCSPKGIIDSLNLLKPIYKKTAFGGHFGREPFEDYFPWERLNKVDELRNKLKALSQNS